MITGRLARQIRYNAKSTASGGGEISTALMRPSLGAGPWGPGVQCLYFIWEYEVGDVALDDGCFECKSRKFGMVAFRKDGLTEAADR